MRSIITASRKHSGTGNLLVSSAPLFSHYSHICCDLHANDIKPNQNAPYERFPKDNREDKVGEFRSYMK